MAHAYTEDQLVERPAIELFAELGWTTIAALEEIVGPGGTVGRETKSEVVLSQRLREMLEHLNVAMPPEAITAAIDAIARDRSAMSASAANREVWELLRDGITVSVPDRPRAGQKTERGRVGVGENPQANEFLLVSQ